MRLTVHLGNRSYPIILDRGVASSLPNRLKKQFPGAKFALVTNTTIARLYKKQISKWQRELSGVTHVMPDGERYKTVETWNRVLNTLLDARLERSSVIVALGGGVVGDVAGFAAASFLRGVRFVQVPTTLLAMVDSSVGGKTGVDHRCGKNLIGAFHQPSLVLVDTDFLKTLSRRQFLAGYAELFKYAFIGGKTMFDFVRKNHDCMIGQDPAPLIEGIRRSIRIKASVVEKDEHETTGARMLLNFGHTFAHALEKRFGYAKLLHGEAVWWGMICACELGRRLGTIPAKDLPLYEAMVDTMPRPRLPGAVDPSALLDAMRSDKKVAGGKIRFVVPTAPGESIVRNDVSKATIGKVFSQVFS